MATVKKPGVQVQGKCVVDVCPTGGGSFEYTVMYPNGDCDCASSHADAEKRCNGWFKRHGSRSKIRVGKIEWRRKS